MARTPDFKWDAETGTAMCTVSDGNGHVYFGMANCHPDDMDFMSEKTGCEIAYRRAKINALRGYRDNLKAQLGALTQVHENMKTSTRFNPKSYENVMLQRHIRRINFDLTTAKEMIISEQLQLRDMLQKKDVFYRHTRARRKANSN